MTQYQVLDLKCAGCGEPVSTAQQSCKYCGRPVMITSFTSVYSMSAQDMKGYIRTYTETLRSHPQDAALHSSMGMCYLKTQLYDKALECFERAIESDFDQSETYFYAAVSLLNGKKAFLAQKATIEKAMKYVQAALQIENRGVYHYFHAYLKYDFFERKFLNIKPPYQEELEQAKQNHVSPEDIRILFEVLNVDKPAAL